MNHKDFAKHWKKKKSDKYYSKYVPNFSTKKTVETLISEMTKLKTDYRKLDYEDKKAVMEKIFGDTKKQYSADNLNGEIKNCINTGLQRAKEY